MANEELPSFQRAIDTVPKDEAAVEGTLKNFLDGVALTERELLNVLERNGVKRVDPMGARFDPNHHQAMMEMDNPDVPAGTVVRVFQPAYLIEDRILRPAMVVVSRGGPKLAKVPSEATLAGEIFPEPASDTTAEDQPYTFLFNLHELYFYDRKFRNVKLYVLGTTPYSFDEWYIPKELQKEFK